jgi:hypothetical protein
VKAIGGILHAASDVKRKMRPRGLAGPAG